MGNAGGMWGRVPGHLTREQCAAWCKSDSRCVGYTFVKTEPSADNCAVKSSWNEASRRPGSGCCDSQQITRGCVSPIFDVSSTTGQCMSGNYDIGTVYDKRLTLFTLSFPCLQLLILMA